MNYAQCLEYLYSKLPMFGRIGPAAIKNNLDNTIKLCDRLGNPHKKFKSIHVAGTNGKGSVSHMLASVFQTAGYKTGLYTSPHLKDFRERIRINGNMIEEQDVINFTQMITPMIEEIEPSFFEVTVAMAFDHFYKNEVDIAIIETGLGGRLDSTNVITPELSIITNIGYDHMNILGNSLGEIGLEKAGIIKNDTPVIIGNSIPETKSIFLKKAAEMHAEIKFAEDCYLAEISEINIDRIVLKLTEIQTNQQIYVASDLPGLYQKENITTVITAIDTMNSIGWKIKKDAIAEGILKTKSNTFLFGRWDVMKKDPLIVLDVAHNEDGMSKLMSHLSQFNFEEIHFILGFSKDKEYNKILDMLPINASLYFTSTNSPRALDHKILLESAKNKNLAGRCYDNVNDALKDAMKHAGKNDLIIVSGSIYVVGDVDREAFC